MLGNNLFLACDGYGVAVTYNDGNTFTLLIGKANDHYFVDIASTTDGKLIAYLSGYGYNASKLFEGNLYVSFDTGKTWKIILLLLSLLNPN